MDTKSSKGQKRPSRESVISTLNVTIEAVNLAKEVSSVTPAKAVFGSVSVILTMIKESMTNESDCVDLGLACADVCKALDRGMKGKTLDDVSQSVRDAIEQLTRAVAEIREKITEKRGRNLVSRLFHAKDDKETIGGWKLDLNRILHVFNTELAINTNVTVSGVQHDVSEILDGQSRSTELAINTHVAVSDVRHDVSEIRRDVSEIREEIDSQTRSTQAILDAVRSTVSPSHSVPPGELPPPPLRACFGRDELVDKIVDLAENLTPVALIGPGGIGKTSVALAVLHHDHIKNRFGIERRFIRCDQFPPSHTHLLSRLSKAIGAGVENPEDLTPLRSFLTSKEIIIVLDNAESILDPQGPNALEIYAVVEELSQFNNICLCITSRISTIPPDCETIDVPTLPAEAARDTFYRIYKNSERSDLVNGILEELDFHPLSITLLATVAHHSKWDANRLSGEWDKRRVDVLRTQHNRSLAATIELSLASLMFQELGPDARGLLGVIAFFPQGIDEKNLEWLFPTVSDRAKAFDNFCILSLTYRSNGFVTMLAPLRDYLSPKDPKSSPLLCTTKECYFRRLSVRVHPDSPSFEEARWITSEDVNVEQLLDVFTSADTGSDGVWDACAHFMDHLYWHKPRVTMLGPRIEGLPDDHPSKPECLSPLSQLFQLVGRFAENKRLLEHTLKLWRERRNDSKIAQTLRFLCDANRMLGLRKEGIRQGKEALEIYERLNDASKQARCLQYLTYLLCEDEQLDAAEEAVLQAIDLLSDKGNQFLVCECHHVLGNVCHSRGETEKAINHFEAALGIASPFNWQHPLFWVNYSLAQLFLGKKRFADAHTHVERVKSHVNSQYELGRAMLLQAKIWYGEGKLEEAKSELLRAADVFKKIGATRSLETCRYALQMIEKEMKT